MFPIYQNQVQRNYPDARSMVVDFASVGDKILKGVTEGVELGLKVKQSRENSALNAMNIQRSQVAIDATLQEMRLNEKRTEQTLQLGKIEQRNKELDFARKTSENANRIYEANAATQAAQSERNLNAVQTLSQYADAVSDLTVNHANMLARLSETSDFSEQHKIVTEYQSQAQEFETMTGKSLIELAADLPPNDPRSQILNGLRPSVLSAAFQDTQVPIEVPRFITSDPRFASADEADQQALAEMIAMTGKGGYSKSDMTIKFVPLKQATQMWKSGNSINTLKNMYQNANDQEAFMSWAKRNGLSKILTQPTDAKPAAESPPVPTTVTVKTASGKEVTVKNPYMTTPEFADKTKEQLSKIEADSPTRKGVEKEMSKQVYAPFGTGVVLPQVAQRLINEKLKTDPQLQAEETEYYERKKTEVQKELDALKGSDIKTLNRKLELNQVAARLDEKAKSLREQYGVTTVKEKELPVLTPEQARQQPPGTRFQTTDGRILTVPERK